MMSVQGATSIDRSERHPYLVVHPLFDRPEEKLRPERLGPMAMKRSVKASLLVLRAYLILATCMFGYHFLELAGILGPHGK